MRRCETPEQGIDALASTGDPWLRSCAAYAIGSLGLVTLAHHLEAWRDDPDPLLRETVRQASARLAAAPPRRLKGLDAPARAAVYLLSES